MPKFGLVFINQNNNKLLFDFYFIQTKTKNVFQKLFGPKKEFAFDTLGNYRITMEYENDKLKGELRATFADIISFYDKYKKDQIYTNLYLDNDIFFESKIDLPKLSGKVLTDSLNLEINNRFEIISKDFEYIASQSLNDDKGYSYDLLFYNIKRYKEILDIFQTLNIVIDRAYYAPSMYSSYFGKPDNIEKNIMFISFHLNYTKIVLGVKGKVVVCRTFDFGLEEINKAIASSCEVDLSLAASYRHDNRKKILVKQVISRSVKKIVNEVLISFKYSNEKNLDKIIIASEDGEGIDLLPPFQRNFKDLCSVYGNNKKDQIYHLIDISLEKNKEIIELPLKVKSNGKE